MGPVSAAAATSLCRTPTRACCDSIRKAFATLPSVATTCTPADVGRPRVTEVRNRQYSPPVGPAATATPSCSRCSRRLMLRSARSISSVMISRSAPRVAGDCITSLARRCTSSSAPGVPLGVASASVVADRRASSLTTQPSSVLR
jgi:hypothetical protein